MTPMPRKLPALAATLALVPLLGCVSLPSAEDTRRFTLDDEWRLGALLESELVARAQPLENEEAQRLLGELTRPLIRAGALGERDWTVLLLADPVPYSLHSPGGRLYVSTGLVASMADESSFRALLAHEVAHAQLRHGTRQLTRSHGREMMLLLARGEKDAVLQDVSANLLAGGTFARFGEEAERQADAEALRLLEAMGAAPSGLSRGLTELWSSERTLRGKRSRYLLCHPLSTHRLDEIEAKLSVQSEDPEVPDSLAFRRLRELLPR